MMTRSRLELIDPAEALLCLGVTQGLGAAEAALGSAQVFLLGGSPTEPQPGVGVIRLELDHLAELLAAALELGALDQGDAFTEEGLHGVGWLGRRFKQRQGGRGAFRQHRLGVGQVWMGSRLHWSGNNRRSGLGDTPLAAETHKVPNQGDEQYHAQDEQAKDGGAVRHPTLVADAIRAEGAIDQSSDSTQGGLG